MRPADPTLRSVAREPVRDITRRASGARTRLLPHPGAAGAVRWTHPHSYAVSPSPAATGALEACNRGQGVRGDEEHEWGETENDMLDTLDPMQRNLRCEVSTGR